MPSSHPPPFNPQRVLDALGHLADAFALDVIDECDSTNTCLRDQPPADDGRVHVLLAHRQRAGRGRRGRSWQAWAGHSLTFSALWRFDPTPVVPAGLSLVAGLAVARALESSGVEGVQLKWPNDVMVFGAKIAGILVELIPGRGRTPAAIIGIGLNLEVPADAVLPEHNTITSLSEHLSPPVPAELVLARILASLDELLKLYAQGGFAALRGAWEQRNAFAGLPVTVVGDSTETLGLCLGVDEDGALLLQGDEGRLRILSGDVSLRLSR